LQPYFCSTLLEGRHIGYHLKFTKQLQMN